MNIFGSLHYNAIGPWLTDRFGEKVIKLSLDGGFTCPNRDGTCGTGGCAFCSGDGSGSYASKVTAETIEDAMKEQITAQTHKWPEAKYIAYFQNHTNTYAPPEKLRELWDAALAFDGVIGLAVATRPDCLPEEILDLLEEYNQKTFLWVELGLQTANEKTAAEFNRGYGNAIFEKAMKDLSSRGIKTVVHLILGLSGENRDDFLRSAEYVSAFDPFGIKLHMLHIMKNTAYAVFANDKLLSREEYVTCICDILEQLPPTITIHRLTGDAPGDQLLAPEWTRNKHSVLNAIQHEFAMRGTWQGIYSK